MMTRNEFEAALEIERAEDGAAQLRPEYAGRLYAEERARADAELAAAKAPIAELLARTEPKS
jgi:hypothetical protein